MNKLLTAIFLSIALIVPSTGVIAQSSLQPQSSSRPQSSPLPVVGSDSIALSHLDEINNRGRKAVSVTFQSWATLPQNIDLRDNALAAVADTLAEIDSITPAPCFQSYWATLRSAYMLQLEGYQYIILNDFSTATFLIKAAGYMVSKLALAQRALLDCSSVATT